GFHYQSDHHRNQKVFGTIEQRIIDIKRNAYAQAHNIHITTPSNWLCEESRASDLLGRFPHSHIFNSINHEVFKIIDRRKARKALGIPIEKKVLAFVSESLDNHRKGFDLLESALEKVNDESLLICTVGSLLDKPNVYFELGPIWDPMKMALLYNAADAFIMPSREDNLPNVMVESLACGTPVIAFPIGGVVEGVVHGKTGILATQVTATALTDAIYVFLKQDNHFEREKIRAFSLENFSVERQVDQFIKIYDQMLNH
ncbi:MAG: glycosyltransferase, partial [Marinoscillum sp.]